MTLFKEKYLFDKIHSKGELLNDMIHVYLLDDENGIRYRCDCGDLGSFEIALIDGSEEFIVSLNDWVGNDENWYLFDGNYHDDFPELNINKAIDYINSNL